jgi:TolB protein
MHTNFILTRDNQMNMARLLTALAIMAPAMLIGCGSGATQAPTKPSGSAPGAPAPPTVAEESKTEKLVFTSVNIESKQFTVVSMNADGTARTTLTKGDSMEADPALSPDGKWVALVVAKKDARKSDICVMNSDGTGRRTILQGEGDRFALSPVWSPDGQKIAYTVPQDGVIVMDADGKNPKVLGGGMVADWSPDGQKILYTVIGGGGETIHTMDADGKNATEVVKGHAMSGAYSPDGKRLVYVASPDGPRSRPAIFIADADGKNARRLTHEEKAVDAYPRWSADGRHIYFTRLTGPDPPPGRAAIHIMDADGSNVKELTKGKEMDMLAGQGMTLWLYAAPPAKPRPPKIEKK